MPESNEKDTLYHKDYSSLFIKEELKSVPTTENRSKAAIQDFISKLPAFKNLPTDDLKSLAEVSWFSSIKAKEYLKFEGDIIGKNCFVMVRGRLAMKKTSSNGRQLTVELLGPDDIFGLIAALAAKNPLGKKNLELLSAHAQINSMVLWIPIVNVLKVLNDNPDIYPDLIAYLLDHLHSSYRLSRGLAHDRVEVRIAAVLLTLADQHARYHEQPQPVIDITRQQLANLTGTTIESAIRITRAMEKEGILELNHPGEINLLKINKLELMVDDS